MAVDTYAPEKLAIIVGGFIMQGYADGTFVNVERNTETFQTVVGADGEGTRVKSADKSGKITITLKQSSDSNDVLSGLEIADEATLQGYVPVLVKDANGRSLYAAETAWVEKPANAEFSKELSNREWVIATDKLIPFTGGND